MFCDFVFVEIVFYNFDPYWWNPVTIYEGNGIVSSEQHNKN